MMDIHPYESLKQNYNFTITIVPGLVISNQNAINNTVEDDGTSPTLLAKITKISQDGEIFVTFTEKLYIPKDFKNFTEE